MKFGYSLMILAASVQVANADADITERYALPHNKVYLESCRREALLLHPGVVEKQRILHRHGDFWSRYEIQALDGSEWFVLCDLAKGSIIREQELVDNAF